MSVEKGSIKLFVNASSVLISGGLILSQNIINSLVLDKSFNIVITCPDLKPYKKFQSEKSELIVVPKWMLKKLFRWFHDYLWLPLLIKKENPHLVLTLSNLPAITKYKQLFLHDNAYVFEDTNSKIPLSFYKRTIHLLRSCQTLSRMRYVNLLIVQTEYQKRLIQKKIVHSPPIVIIPPGIPTHLTGKKSNKTLKLSTKYLKIACISRYFEHKNLEILYDVAEFCSIHELPYQFILTISEDGNPGARRLIKKIRKNNYNNRIVNVGEIKKKEIANFIDQVDALIIPSLMETFGLNCIEAWYSRKPIFVSDINSLRSSCREAAFYFNPYSCESIIDTLVNAFRNPDQISCIIEFGKDCLSALPDWKEYSRLIKKIYDKDGASCI